MAQSKPKSRGPFASGIAKAAKRRTGRTTTEQTPLAVRTSGLSLTPKERERIAARVGSKLGKFALHIERATVRLDNVNGPKGGVDTRCRIKVTISGRPSLVVEKDAESVRKAFDLAVAATERAVRKALAQADMSAPPRPRSKRTTPAPEASAAATVAKKVRAKKTSRPVEPSSPLPGPEDGSLIGRRVGRSAAVLANVADRPEKRRGDALVDTAKPGVSATDRKVGAGSTAKRNTKLNPAGLVAALEDSQGRPSRKSTRKSAGRAKRDAPQRLAEVAALRSSKSRATAATAGKRSRKKS